MSAMTAALIPGWMAVSLGSWSEVAINWPWILMLLRLGLLMYGEARAQGQSVLIALLFAYLLVSLPLLNLHVALAGYADLLAGLILLAALVSLYRARLLQSRRNLLLGVVLLLALVSVKNEGLIWAAAGLEGFAYSLLR